MKVWYEVSDEGVHLAITRLIAPDEWTPEADSRTYPTWADARHNAIERQRWVLRTREYDPAQDTDLAVASLRPEQDAQVADEVREHIEGLFKDLEHAPDNEHGFVVFEESRLSRLGGRIDNLPRTEIVPGTPLAAPEASTPVPADGYAEAGRGGVDRLPGAGDFWDGWLCGELYDALIDGLVGYRGQCAPIGGGTRVKYEVLVKGRLSSSVEIDLLALQEDAPALRFAGTVSPPPFVSRQDVVAWAKRLIDLVAEDGGPRV